MGDVVQSRANPCQQVRRVLQESRHRCGGPRSNARLEAGCPSSDIVVKPISEAARLNRLWMPIRLLVLRKQLIFNCCSADIPGWLRVIDQNSVTAPAVWIGVLILGVSEHQATSLEILNENLVSIFKEFSAYHPDIGEEGAIWSDGVHNGKTIALTNL